jgi:serine protease Do
LAALAGNNNPLGDGNDDDAQGSTPQAAQAALGLSVQTLNDQIARQVGVPAGTRGLVIAQVNPSSDAATKGLQRGDVILSAGQTPVTTLAQLSAAVAAAKAANRSSVLLQVQRGGNPPRYVGVRFN